MHSLLHPNPPCPSERDPPVGQGPIAAATPGAYRARSLPAHPHPFIHRVRSWPRTIVVTVAVVVIVLVAARIALPLVVRRMMNDRLERIPGYTGHVEDVSLHLWRGAYSLHGFSILREDGRVEEPFFRAKGIDIAIAWRDVWRGRFVSNIKVDEGQIHFVKGASEEESQTDLDRRWQDVIQDLFPIDITHLEITDGLLRYINRTREPKVDLFVTHMRVSATGLRNRAEEAADGEFPARIIIEGESLGGGRLLLLLNAEPLAAEPHFHLTLELDNVNLPALNESLRAYANVDVGRGTFRLVGEMAGRDGGFQGYVKPFFEDLDFRNIEDKEKGVGALVWERFVAVFTWVVKDKSRDQLATRIPFEGKFGDAKVGLLATIANLFRHGFIRAFNPTVEGSVNAANILPSGKSADPAARAEKAPDGKPAEIEKTPKP
jgi:hypothetical protein